MSARAAFGAFGGGGGEPGTTAVGLIALGAGRSVHPVDEAHRIGRARDRGGTRGVQIGVEGALFERTRLGTAGALRARLKRDRTRRCAILTRAGTGDLAGAFGHRSRIAPPLSARTCARGLDRGAFSVFEHAPVAAAPGEEPR